MNATHTRRWQAATVAALLLSAISAAPASAGPLHDPSLPALVRLRNRVQQPHLLATACQHPTGPLRQPDRKRSAAPRWMPER